MSERIRVQPLAVATDLLDDLGLGGADEARVVRESFAFLLDREPATSIYDEFPLDTVVGRFPDFPDELRTRLAS